MTTRKLLTICACASLVISLPFTILHLGAKPDNTPITALQHLTAAAANFFGPWGVAIVRLVDFPNAGLRSFSWLWAIGLTVMGALLLALAMRVKNPRLQILMVVFWTLFSMAWFGLGLTQIADGLL